jgi:hypothetical protein
MSWEILMVVLVIALVATLVAVVVQTRIDDPVREEHEAPAPAITQAAPDHAVFEPVEETIEEPSPFAPAAVVVGAAAIEEIRSEHPPEDQPLEAANLVTSVEASVAGPDTAPVEAPPTDHAPELDADLPESVVTEGEPPPEDIIPAREEDPARESVSVEPELDEPIEGEVAAEEPAFEVVGEVDAESGVEGVSFNPGFTAQTETAELFAPPEMWTGDETPPEPESGPADDVSSGESGNGSESE